MVDLDTMTSGSQRDRGRRHVRSTGLTALLVATVALTSAAGRPAGAEPVVVRLGAVLPRQSPWVSALYRLAARVKKQTRGRVIVKVYAGGTAGSEHNSIRLLKQGKLQAVAVSAAVIGAIEPTLRVLDLPVLIQSQQELFYVYHHMEATMQKRLGAKGHVLLGMTTLGPTYLFSKRPLRSLRDFRVARVFVYAHDPIALELARVAGVRMVPRDLTGALPALKARTVDTVYSPPHVVLAMGWYSHVSWMVDFRMNFTPGFFVMRRDAFSALSAGQQKIVTAAARTYTKEMYAMTSRLNARALKVMKATGLRVCNPTSGLRAYFTRLGRKTWNRLQGRLHSAEDLGRIQTLLVRCRTTSCRF